MLSPFFRALAYYGFGGFGAALLCALWVFDDPAAPASTARRARRSVVCSVLGLFHPVIALSAYDLARPADRGEADDGRVPRRRLASVASLAVSTMTMVGVLVTTADL